jgi:hypothetical protein
MDRVDFITAAHANLLTRQKSIEMAYTAVKRIIDRNATGLGRINTSAGDLDSFEVGGGKSTLELLVSLNTSSRDPAVLPIYKEEGTTNGKSTG